MSNNQNLLLWASKASIYLHKITCALTENAELSESCDASSAPATRKRSVNAMSSSTAHEKRQQKKFIYRCIVDKVSHAGILDAVKRQFGEAATKSVGGIVGHLQGNLAKGETLPFSFDSRKKILDKFLPGEEMHRDESVCDDDDEEDVNDDDQSKKRAKKREITEVENTDVKITGMPSDGDVQRNTQTSDVAEQTNKQQTNENHKIEKEPTTPDDDEEEKSTSGQYE